MSELRLVCCEDDCLCHMTFSRFADKFIEDYAMLYKGSWKEDKRRLKNVVVPLYGARLFTDISERDISNLHKARARRLNRNGKPCVYEANRVVELLHKMYEWAREEKLVVKAFENPAVVKRFDEFPREEVINDEEMERLIDSILTLRFRSTITYYSILIVTAFRKKELLSLEWKDVDFGSMHFHVQREHVKSKRAHKLPITPFVHELLLNLPRSSKYVFPAHYGKDGHLTYIEKSWKNVRARAKLEHKILHDIRRTAGAWLANEDVSAQVIQKMLNHSSIQATQVYMPMQTSAVRRVMLRYEAKIVSTGKFSRFLKKERPLDQAC